MSGRTQPTPGAADYALQRVLVEGTITSAPYMARAKVLFEAGLLPESWLRDTPPAGDDPAASAGRPPPGPEPEPPGRGVWLEGVWWAAADVARLREVPYAGVRRLLDLCAERAGEWVPKADADDPSGPRQLAGELAAFSKFVFRELGRRDWPMQWRKLAGTYDYMMTPEMAALWRS